MPPQCILESGLCRFLLLHSRNGLVFLGRLHIHGGPTGLLGHCNGFCEVTSGARMFTHAVGLASNSRAALTCSEVLQQHFRLKCFPFSQRLKSLI